jgi:hypothetical protein
MRCWTNWESTPPAAPSGVVAESFEARYQPPQAATGISPMKHYDKRLFIQEVATRDGFQNEAQFTETVDKIAMIDALSPRWQLMCRYQRFSVARWKVMSRPMKSWVGLSGLLS